MKYGIALLSILLATTSFAEQAKLQCWSGHYEIFKKSVDDVFPGDGFLAAVDKRNTYMIVGDCVVTYKNEPKPKHKHKKAKK